MRELVRADVVKELTFTGRVIDGYEAARIGMVTRVSDDPMKASLSLAKELLPRSPDAIASAKQLFQKAWVADEKTALDEETALQRSLLPSWNQVATSLQSMGVPVPHLERGGDYNLPRG